MDNRILQARLLAMAAVICAIIGLIAGAVEPEWRLGVTGWFTAGTLLAVLALVALADHYFASRRDGAG